MYIMAYLSYQRHLCKLEVIELFLQQKSHTSWNLSLLNLFLSVQ